MVISEDLAQFTITAVKTDFCDSHSEVTDVKKVSLDVTNRGFHKLDKIGKNPNIGIRGFTT